MQKQKLKDSSLGYAKDFVSLMTEILPDIVEKKITVITNGGGANPSSCKDAIFAAAKKIGIKKLKIGVVLGDDILSTLDSLYSHGVSFNNMETGELFETIRSKIVSANAYFGAQPIVEALRQDAQIIITGRTTDTGLTLAPMMYEFGWENDDWDKLAAGTVAGHILECGAQASGGNFSGDWKSVPDLAHVGFPIAEAFPDGTFFITKHENTGGLVSEATVKEQLLYEIGNPTMYITPDCIADFTTIQLHQEEKNKVKVFGIKGKPATEFFKVSMSYHDGFTAFGTLTYAWPDAVEKAQKADEIIRTRLSEQNILFDEIRSELLGFNSSFGPRAENFSEQNEVVLRIGVRSNDKNAIEAFSREIAPLVLTGPPSVTGFAGGRPRPSDVIAYWPSLVPKKLVPHRVVVEMLE
jgi:hypothetical protein